MSTQCSCGRTEAQKISPFRQARSRKKSVSGRGNSVYITVKELDVAQPGWSRLWVVRGKARKVTRAGS